MSKHELLNNIDHKDLRVVTKLSKELGDSHWYAPTFWREFRSVQAHYPILFKKNTEGGFLPLAFFGFQKDENLFLTSNGWDASYIPLSVKRMPFFVGFQSVNDDGKVIEQRVITIDTESPKITTTEEGQPLFLEYGGNSEYLDSMANILETLHQGVQENHEFIEALEENDLLEPVTINVKLNNGSNNQMIGFHTINEEKLNQLPNEKIVELHQKGYLQAMYCAVISQVKFNELANKKNALVERL